MNHPGHLKGFKSVKQGHGSAKSNIRWVVDFSSGLFRHSYIRPIQSRSLILLGQMQFQRILLKK